MNYLHAVHFTVDEAKELLKEVVPILQEISQLKGRLDLSGYDIRGHHLYVNMGVNGTKPYPDEVNELIERFRGLTSKGIVVKDMNRGLIDFPCIRSNGQEVYLCYLLGEPTIEYWHGIEDGFAGRQPIEAL